VFVEHVSRALLRRGHQVDVIHSDDAFASVRGGQPERPFTAIPGLRVHSLRSRTPLLSSLWIHQTSRLGALRRSLQRIIDAGRFDVLHFHNISLIGGAEALTLHPAEGRPVKLMTAHERGGLGELVKTAGGPTYRTDEELLAAMRQIMSDSALRGELAAKSKAALETQWSEEAHIDRYMRLIAGIRHERPGP
jgi:hypothetical protein